MRTKRILCIGAAFLLASIPVFAGGKSEKPAQAAKTIAVVDQTGTRVTVPADIKRVAVCGVWPLPSVLAVFFDSADKLVGIPPASMAAAKNSLLSKLYPEILNAKTNYTKGESVNVEELLKLKPDVVFYSSLNPQIGATLKRAGFTAVGVSVSKWNYNCVETLNHWIALLSQMFPANDKASLVRTYSDNALNLIQSRIAGLADADRARIFFLFNYTGSTIVTSGGHFFGEWWAEAVGAKNAAGELAKQSATPVNLEQIYKWNPSAIFITNFTTAQPADLYNNTIGAYDWSGVDAVKNKRVYKMPLGMYRGFLPGVDTPVTLLWLAKNTYPSLFRDIDITAKTIDYYKTVFGITLSEEQAESIFAPPSAAGEQTER
jgi:iron complex transport system substrate-binding protein